MSAGPSSALPGASTDGVASLLLLLGAVFVALAPVVGTLFGVSIDGIGLGLRLGVLCTAAAVVAVPVPLDVSWRRAIAVALVLYHHLMVGIVSPAAQPVLVETALLLTYFSVSACWWVPRPGVASLGAVAFALAFLVMSPHVADPSVPMVAWAILFLAGGLLGEASVWIGPRVRPPGARSTLEPLLASGGLGVGHLDGSGALVASTPALEALVEPWGSAQAWWSQLSAKGRCPTIACITAEELRTPEGEPRSYRFVVGELSADGRRSLLVQERTSLTVARREARRLRGKLEERERQLASAKATRRRALEARSHALRTPLHNLLGRVDLCIRDTDGRPDLVVMRRDLRHARRAGHELLELVNRELESDLDGSVSAARRLNLGMLLELALDGAARTGPRPTLRVDPSAVSIVGDREELAVLLRAASLAAVAACRGHLAVSVVDLPPGSVGVVFDSGAADAIIVSAALGGLKTELAGVGGVLEMGRSGQVVLRLPRDGSRSEGVESEAAPDPFDDWAASMGVALSENTEDEPTATIPSPPLALRG